MLLQYFYNFTYSLVFHFYVIKTSAHLPSWSSITLQMPRFILSTLLLTCNKFLVNTSISRLFSTNCLSVFDHFVELALKYLLRVNNIHAVIYGRCSALFIFVFQPMSVQCRIAIPPENIRKPLENLFFWKIPLNLSDDLRNNFS